MRVSANGSFVRRVLNEAVHFLAALSVPTGLLVIGITSIATYVGIIKREPGASRNPKSGHPKV